MHIPNKRHKRTISGTQRAVPMSHPEENDGGHHETGLDPIRTGFEIHRGPPNYTHVVLPWIYEEFFTSSTPFNTKDFGIRMTSPYDPFIESTLTDNNAGAGTSLDYALQSDAFDSRTSKGYGVAYWDFYKNLYKYYSVMGCRYKVHVENLSSEKFFVHTMYINNTDPPGTASNWDMMIWQGVQSHLVHPIHRWASGSAINQEEETGQMIDDDTLDPTTGNSSGSYVANPVGSSFAVIAGEYRPGMANHEIHQDDDVEIWTPVTRNPTLREALLIRIKPYDVATAPVTPGDANDYNRPLTFTIRVTCEYLCEFKELDERLRWPVSRNPLTTTISTNPR